MPFDIKSIFSKNFINLTFNQGVNIIATLIYTPILFQILGEENFEDEATFERELMLELEQELCDKPNERDEVHPVDDCASSDGCASASGSEGDDVQVCRHLPHPPAHLLARDVQSCRVKWDSTTNLAWEMDGEMYGRLLGTAKFVNVTA